MITPPSPRPRLARVAAPTTLSLVALAAFAAPALAQETPAPPPYQPPDFMNAPPSVPGAADGAAVWRLELDEALRLAIQRNLGVVMERESSRIARLSVDVAGGVFEPGLTLSYRHGDSASPPSTAQEGMAGEIFTTVDDAIGLGYQQRFATGLELSATLDTGRTRSSLGTAVEPLTIRSTLSVGLRQPLLRGFSTDLAIPRLTVLRARLGSQRQRHQLAITIADVVERTERAYWDVVQALYRHDLDVRSTRRAEEQLALTRRQIEAGVLPPSDLIAAQSTLAQRELQELHAEQVVEAAWDELRAVLDLPRDQWQRPILPVDAPRFEPATLSMDDAMAQALASRPEYAQLALEVDEAALAVRKARNDRLPQIDLGLDGAVYGQDADYGGAVDQLASVDARGWSVGVNLAWTPHSRATAAAVDIERSRARVVTARRDQARAAVWAEVRAAVRNQDSAARQVAAAARFRELAEDSLAVEERKFLNGTSSNFVVAQRQEEVAAAQLAELSALLDHHKATTALLHVTGTLLDARHIELDAPAK